MRAKKVAMPNKSFMCLIHLVSNKSVEKSSMEDMIYRPNRSEAFWNVALGSLNLFIPPKAPKEKKNIAWSPGAYSEE